MPLIEIPDADIWYEDTGGDGPPVVFVHPAAASSETWEQQIPAFVAAGYRCITYDLRGWGRSREKPGAADHGHISTDLEALTQALGLERFALVAAAYGGMGALDYVLRFPDRVQAFVLATSQGAITDESTARPSRGSCRRAPGRPDRDPRGRAVVPSREPGRRPALARHHPPGER